MALLASALLVAGCRHQSFARNHLGRALHIFGIGWISETSDTNKIRAFAIGLMDSAHYSTTINTGAPTTTLLGEIALTNYTPPPPTNSTWTTPPPPQTNNPAPPPSRP